mgnify:CR=1 FL=1
MFHDFSQLFIQEISLLGESAERFASRPTIDDYATPLHQIQTATPMWEVTGLFLQLERPWGKIMRHFSASHEKSIAKALSAPGEAEEHLLEARRHLERFNTIWDVMERIVKDGKTKPYCDKSSARESLAHLSNEAPYWAKIVVDELEEHWNDIYSNLYTIASYAIPDEILYLDRPAYGQKLLAQFFEYVRPHLVGEAYLIYENNEPLGEDVPYCDLECALWQLIGVLGDGILKALEMPPEIFSKLYNDAKPVVYTSTFY